MSQAPTKYAFICTRSQKFSDTLSELLSYLSRAGVKVKLLVGEKSIFSAYKKAFESTEMKDNDIYMFCHDDITIYNNLTHFNEVLNSLIFQQQHGFYGVAGTTELGRECVWWDHARWADRKHRGFVLHRDAKNPEATHYGPYEQVLVLDGLFLAATGKTLKKLTFEKPESFVGEWDFYDLWLTYQAHKLGLENRTVPLFICHQSMGSLVGREGWEANRLAFSNLLFQDRNITNITL